MPVKWKKNKNLKPQIILSKINSIKTVTDDKKISYSGFEYHNVMAVLQNMIQFPKSFEELDKESIISEAVNNIAKKADLDNTSVIDEINSLVRYKLAIRQLKYHMLTTISIKRPFPSKRIILEDSTIRILDYKYPKKYIGRDEIISKQNLDIVETPSNYTKLIVTLKSKSLNGAITKALRVLDIQRSIWCLFGNASWEIGGDDWQPINRIRLGGKHTLHKNTGKLATKVFWYEPNFVKTKLFYVDNFKDYKKNCAWALKQLKLSKYKTNIKDALIRYVRALDERDQNVALIRLWGAIEALAAPSESNYDLVTRRCSFLYSDQEYHKQVLEHLREYRNCSVHAGDQIGRAKTNCYQLQNYFYSLIIFHLKSANDFSSLEEANNFLDLPSNKKYLQKKKLLIEKAIKFIS
ncbi:MAG: hypothetical protein K8S13_13275 [Desulfobacula sp.]|uniref:hypothetical protein n=1 Tax=Desulfobacula sp. TaxID=2593537 RepID=UPI0025C196BF|nr:hypothetical protein [Desulfobacula sp.]MCD4720810.1 hypothetical protein [Desulfobacula sp.]